MAKSAHVVLLLAAAHAKPLPPDTMSLQTASCPEESSRDSYYNFVVDAHASTTVTTAFGRSLNTGSCACRFCATTSDAHVPPNVTTDADAPLCLSSDPEPMVLVFDVPSFTCKTATFAESHVETQLADGMQAATECLTPDRSGADGVPTATMFLIGDSVSGALIPALALAVRGKYQLRSMYVGQYGSLMANGTNYPEYLRTTGFDGNEASPSPEPKVADALHTYYDHLIQTLQENVRPGDVIAIHEQTTNMLDARIVHQGLPEGNPSPKAVEALERDIINGIAKPQGAKVVIFGSWNTNSWDLMNRKVQAKKLAEGVVSRNSRMSHFVDLFPHFCDGDVPDESVYTDLDDGTTNTTAVPTCSTFLPGTGIDAYRDDFHINSAGAVYLWPYVCSALTDAGLMD